MAATRAPHRIRLFEVTSAKDPISGRTKSVTRPLGEIPLDHIPNMERRKEAAKNAAEAHAGRKAASVSHGEGGDMVVTFRKEVAS